MAWNDATEVFIGSTGEVYVAPVGTTLPTTATQTLNSAFSGLGFVTEDGVTENNSPEVLTVNAWQSRFPIRTERLTEDFRLTFSLMQWNEATVPFAFGGGAVVSDGASGYRYNPPLAVDAMDYRALVFDSQDGSRHNRLVIARGAVVEGVESQFARSQEAPLPITFQANPIDESAQPYYKLFDDAAAFAAGS